MRNADRAPLKTNTSDLEDENARIIVQNEPQHTHAEEDTLIEKSEIKSKLVETAKQDPSVPIKRVYNTVVRRHQHSAIFKYSKWSLGGSGGKGLHLW